MEPQQTLTSQKTTISIGNWLGTIILLSIPFVNIIAIVYYLVSSNTSQTKKNYVWALLILIVIAIALGFIFGVSLGSVIPAGEMVETSGMMEMEMMVEEM